MAYQLFVINPGSTSTKLAWYSGTKLCQESVIRHEADELGRFAQVIDQLNHRLMTIVAFTAQQGIDLSQMDAIVGRGGFLRPLKSGTYRINEVMLSDLRRARFGEHASNLGAILAHQLAEPFRIPSYIVNPVVVDELMDEARLTGVPEVIRKSAFHALNHKAVAIRAAKEVGLSYEEANFIVAHLGGGISVGAHREGRVVDVNNALVEGPFSPERAGTVPPIPLVEMCFSGNYTKKEVLQKLVGKGGLFAYTKTTDVKQIQVLAEENPQYKLLLQAMCFRIAREICACSAALYGRVDQIIITGGLAHSPFLMKEIEKRVSFLAKVVVYPGENEMEALAEGVLRVLSGEENCMEYKEVDA